MRRRSLTVALAAVVATIALAAPQLASSAPREDPSAQRDRVRAERAELATRIDASTASMAEIDDAIQALQENLAGEERALEQAEAAVAQAIKDIADAEEAIAERNEEIAILEVEMRQRAVRAYVSPTGDDVLTVLGTKDFTSAAERRFFVDLRAQDDADVADRLDGAVTDLAYQQRKAAAAKKRADAEQAEQVRRTESVREAKTQQQALLAKLQSTVNSQISRSVELGKTDRALSAQIATRQAELVARIAAQQAAQEEADRRAADVAKQPGPTTPGPTTPGPTTPGPATPGPTIPRPTTPPPATPRPPTPPSNQSPGGGETRPLPPVNSGGGGTGTGGIPLCTVGGITVNCAIQSQVASLLNAARGSGVMLSGGGYRDPSAQIGLRKAHCGTSYYAIYEMPASSCRPPTARPGTSQHEVGLAIDFSNCSSRATACYRWLAGNAAGYGFYNLPSEPWHWSTSGN